MRSHFVTHIVVLVVSGIVIGLVFQVMSRSNWATIGILISAVKDVYKVIVVD